MGPDPFLLSPLITGDLAEGVTGRDEGRNQGTTSISVQSSALLPATLGSGAEGRDETRSHNFR